MDAEQSNPVEKEIEGLITRATAIRTLTPERALQDAYHAIALARRHDLPRLRCDAYSCAAFISIHQNRLSLAEEFGDVALKLACELDYPHGTANAQLVLGIAASKRRDESGAFNALSAAYQTFELEGDELGTARALNYLGVLAHTQGDEERAISCFSRSREIYEKQHDDNSVADELSNIGLIYLDMGRSAKALDYFTQAESRYLETGNATTNVHILMARCHIQLGAFDRVRELLRSARNDAAVQADEYRGAIIDMELAKLVLRDTEIDWLDGRDPVGVLSDGIAVADRLGIGELGVELRETLSRCHESLGDFENAYRVYKEYAEMRFEALHGERSDRVFELMSRFQLEDRTRQAEIYRLRNVELVRLNRRLKRANRIIKRQAREFRRLARADALTGLPNRRAYDEMIPRELARAARLDTRLALAVGDIDHFKLVNDNYSHEIGDQVLKVLAGILAAGIRSSDIVVRYGGEEFVLAFPGTTLEGACQACEAIRRKIADYPWYRLAEDMRVTMSFGVAEWRRGEDEGALFLEADRNLYAAKHEGRNRVACNRWPQGGKSGR